ncbi:lytic murein transglycosylase [Nocardioides sp. CER19]|uniref:lytic murein transglycosylase n=1 Tax=Nocardioides sp. CER19 TaxID=3038538 RepID=UPI00244BDDBD|nr:lytic murein transglycosylase [Nocardioides sp. CER19]MDH2415463.1 lytic murein transglycosylase [Nocardioides sp. CER19]
MTPRIGNLPKAISLVPLAALSVVCTYAVARTPNGEVPAVIGTASDNPTSATSTPATTPTPPASALVVPPATQAPASVWSAGGTAPAAAAVVPASVLSAPAIPPVALAAYQRAATVIDSADATCHLDWSVLAGIGRIESDHGRHAGSALDANGLDTPSVIGPALTGIGGRMLVKDTDGGLLDGDTKFDHAVGPMQFLPSTWSVVGVDADGDGQRNPQDIDDAALAAAVYLCSGPEDLATDAGRQTALLRYNHSTSYVSAVLGVAAAYQAGTGLADPSFVTARLVSPVPFTVEPSPTEPAGTPGHQRHQRHQRHAKGTVTSHIGHPAHASGQPGTAGTPASPIQPPASGEPTPGGGTTTPPATAASTKDLTDLCTDRIDKAYQPTPADVRDQAITSCVHSLDGKTLDDAKANVDDVVTKLPETIDGLVPTPSADPTPSGSPTPTDGSSATDQPTSTGSSDASADPTATP